MTVSVGVALSETVNCGGEATDSTPSEVVRSNATSGVPLTVMVIVSEDCIRPSLVCSSSTYVPAALKVAVVSTAPASPNVTVPAPLSLLQVVVTEPGVLGRESSVTVASRA